MKFFEGRSTRLGPSIWRRVATSMLRTVDDAYWSAICKGGWRPAKAKLKNLRVLDSPIWTGFPGTNDEANRITTRADSSRKREAGLDVACPFVAAFSDAGLGDAIHLAGETSIVSCRVRIKQLTGFIVKSEEQARTGHQTRVSKSSSSQHRMARDRMRSNYRPFVQPCE